MKKSSRDELKMLIVEAEEKKIRLQEEIKADITDFIEQFRPGNLIRKGINSIAHTDHLKEKAIKGGIGIAAGYLFKKLFFKSIKRSMIIGLAGIVARQLITYFATPENMARVSEKISGIISRMRENRRAKDIEVWS